jgi:uncharacterized protein (TIGR03118 family)
MRPDGRPRFDFSTAGCQQRASTALPANRPHYRQCNGLADCAECRSQPRKSLGNRALAGFALVDFRQRHGVVDAVRQHRLAKSLVVTIPAPNGQPGGTPTGTVFNYTGAFEVGPGQSAFFLFATEDGTISGWNPGANPTAAIIKVNRAGSALYKGLVLATLPSGVPRFYASNFQSGKVEVFDGKFHSLTVAGGFVDANLPPNYPPFGIQNVGGNIVVTFAHRKPGSHDEDHGPGRGFVDGF